VIDGAALCHAARRGTHVVAIPDPTHRRDVHVVSGRAVGLDLRTAERLVLSTGELR
jgi:hypothetical protein